MGASVTAYWPGMTDEQSDAAPGFWNDDKAWADWMAERDEDASALAAVRKLGAEAILTVKTDGWDDDDVTWVSPEALRNAAAKLRAAIESNTPEAAAILKSYESGARRSEPVAGQFTRDLDDVVAITRWAEQNGATRMTLEVNW